MGCEDMKTEDHTPVRIGLVEDYILSAIVCAVYVTGLDTFNTSEDYLGVRKKGTRLAMPKTIYAPASSSLKSGSGATEGVLD